MVDFHGHFVDVGFERVVRVGEFGKCKGHNVYKFR
jgi:hypothetical protein